jgi:hypothetical protein
LTAVQTPEGELDRELSDSFMALVAEARKADVDPTGLLTGDAVDRGVSAARRWAGERVAERESEIQRVNDEVIDTQLESLRLSHERRTLRVEAQLREAEEARQTPTARMRAGQLANIVREYDGKRRELEGRRGVEVGHRIVAAGLLVP